MLFAHQGVHLTAPVRPPPHHPFGPHPRQRENAPGGSALDPRRLGVYAGTRFARSSPPGAAMKPNPPGMPTDGREVRDLQVVLGVARAMAGAPDLGTLLALILDALRHLLNAERST